MNYPNQPSQPTTTPEPIVQPMHPSIPNQPIHEPLQTGEGSDPKREAPDTNPIIPNVG